MAGVKDCCEGRGMKAFHYVCRGTLDVRELSMPTLDIGQATYDLIRLRVELPECVLATLFVGFDDERGGVMRSIQRDKRDDFNRAVTVKASSSVSELTIASTQESELSSTHWGCHEA